MKNCLLFISFLCFSVDLLASKPKLAVIIDDIGHQPIPLKISTLPKEISLSIIPFSAFDSHAAYQAYSEGREVMLHLPMQSSGEAGDTNMLNLKMAEQEFKQKVQDAIKRIPNAVAVNNHMGSELTQHLKPMSWLMKILKERDIGFIDSRTTPHTVAQQLADLQGIANNRRHIFLDHERNEAFITKQFIAAVNMASRSDKVVVIIGHPHAVTLQTLNKLLVEFKSQIELIPISYALNKATAYKENNQAKLN